MRSLTTETPIFSIIIPIYNAEKYLRECLDSIAKQSLKNLEVICVDDCSLDNSSLIVQEYSNHDPRFKLISHDANTGPGGARNTGIRVARGKWITFADADDFYIDSNFLTSAKKLLETSNCDLFIFDFKEFDETSKSVITETCRRFPYNIAPKHHNYIWNENERKRYLFEIPPFPFTKIYSREKLVQKNLLYPENIFYEDCAFNNLASAIFERIIAVDWQPYAYRQNVDGQTTQNISKHIGDIVPIHEVILHELNNRCLITKYNGFLKVKFVSVAIRSLVLYFLPQINDFAQAMALTEEIKRFLETLALSSNEKKILKSLSPNDYRILEEILKWKAGLLEMFQLSILGIPILLHYRTLRTKKWCLFSHHLILIKKEELSDRKSKTCILGITVCIRRGHTLYLFGVIPFGKLFSLRHYSENYPFDLAKRNYLRIKSFSVFK